jgi:hypothetical protein
MQGVKEFSPKMIYQVGEVVFLELFRSRINLQFEEIFEIHQ